MRHKNGIKVIERRKRNDEEGKISEEMKIRRIKKGK